MSQKKKKRRKKIKTQKCQNKNKLSVLQSAASFWWPLCVPVARSLPTCPAPAVCPARLPAAPPANDTEFSAWVFGGY
jgi:hypothetical protein